MGKKKKLKNWRAEVLRAAAPTQNVTPLRQGSEGQASDIGHVTSSNHPATQSQSHPHAPDENAQKAKTIENHLQTSSNAMLYGTTAGIVKHDLLLTVLTSVGLALIVIAFFFVDRNTHFLVNFGNMMAKLLHLDL